MWPQALRRKSRYCDMSLLLIDTLCAFACEFYSFVILKLMDINKAFRLFDIGLRCRKGRYFSRF